MATTLDNTHEDLRFYEELKHHAFERLTPSIDKHNKFLIEHGLIQIETLLELAISRVGNIKRDSTYGRDFVDKSDAKKATSVWRNNNIHKGNWLNSYKISNIKTKQGALRIMAFNRFADRFDYYVIPHKAYQHLKGNNLEIVLDSFSGCYFEPTPTGSRAYCHWNIYKKDNFLEMATSSVK